MSGAKAFATLQARFALAGLALVRTNPADGPVRLFLARHGRVREVATIDELEALIEGLEERRQGLELMEQS